MPRDAKRMKPVKAWAVVKPNGSHHCFGVRRATAQMMVSMGVGRIARVEITELPPKRKRHAS